VKSCDTLATETIKLPYLLNVLTVNIFYNISERMHFKGQT